jgi:chaperone modulatory protein CbpM
MTSPKSQYFSFEELCRVTELSSQTVIEIVDHGIVDPNGTTPENWTFNTRMIMVTKKACRLHKDLNIDWPGIALAISLLDELEQAQQENQMLHSRLSRFLND